MIFLILSGTERGIASAQPKKARRKEGIFREWNSFWFLTGAGDRLRCSPCVGKRGASNTDARDHIHCFPRAGWNDAYGQRAHHDEERRKYCCSDHRGQTARRNIELANPTSGRKRGREKWQPRLLRAVHFGQSEPRQRVKVLRQYLPQRERAPSKFKAGDAR